MGGTPPQSPHTTMTIQLSVVINAASEMALSQMILPFPMLWKHACGTKWQKHRPKKSRAHSPQNYFFAYWNTRMLSPCGCMCTEQSAGRCLVTWPDTSQLWLQADQSSLLRKCHREQEYPGHTEQSWLFSGQLQLSTRGRCEHSSAHRHLCQLLSSIKWAALSKIIFPQPSPFSLLKQVTC